MKTCATCQHWNPRDPGEEQRQMAKLKMAVCALGPRWTFLASHHTCPKHAPAQPDVIEKRRIWLAKAK